MKKHNLPVLFITALVFSLLFSCKQNSALTTNEAASVKDSVLLMVTHTSKDITTKGPIAWLDYFENSPDFFMASDGAIVFKDYQSADVFVKNTLVKALPKIDLKWNAIRVDVLTSQIAIVGANFHEDLTDATNKTTAVDGYFTATAHLTDKGWKYRDAHWSIKKGQ